MATHSFRRRYAIARAVLLAFVLILMAACTAGNANQPIGEPSSASPPRPSEPTGGQTSLEGFYIGSFGATSLKERIAKADVVARVQLQSVAAGTERLDWRPAYFSDSRGISAPIDVGAMEFRFKVLEYLKGSGDTEIVAIVWNEDYELATSASASSDANALIASRDSQWDGRDAIVFLNTSHPVMPNMPRTGRYILGSVLDQYGNLGDYYSIASPNDKRWLPAASPGGATGASGEQRFLLDRPAGGASGQAGHGAPTITLAALKAEVARIEHEIASGGGSAYRECLIWKYELERTAEYLTSPTGEFPYGRYDESMVSGQPSGTLAHTYLQEPLPENVSPSWGEFRLVGQDSALFVAGYRGDVTTARPLPAGDYRFHIYDVWQEWIICDAVPEKEQKRFEVFVTVTAPAGTVHEAFFDIFVDAAGVPLPSDFTVGGAGAAIHWLEWRDGTVLLLMAPYADLKGHTLDFIALGGTVALSLDGGAATADPAAGTLTWAVASQPWRQGDELMLRIRKSAAGPTATPTPPPTPTPTPEPPPTAEPPIPYAPAWQPTGAHPGGYARWLWKIAPSTFEGADLPLGRDPPGAIRVRDGRGGSSRVVSFGLRLEQCCQSVFSKRTRKGHTYGRAVCLSSWDEPVAAESFGSATPCRDSEFATPEISMNSPTTSRSG